MNSLKFVISKKKLKTIAKLHFSRIFRYFEIYLNLTNWLRDYISHYASIFKSFQNRKIEFFRNKLVVENARRIYFNKICFQYFTKQKLISFDVLQNILTKFFYLIHSNTKKQLFFDFDVNKKFDFDVMLYYMKKLFHKNDNKYSSRHFIKSILFWVDYIIDVESKYWFIELKITRIVWVLKKTRYIVEITSKTIIIYTNYDVIIEIVKQITLTIIFIDKLNFWLIRAFDYIQRFNLEIKYKLDK